MYCSGYGDIGHSWSSWRRVRAHLSTLLTAGTTTRAASSLLPPSSRFKAVIREAATKVTQKAIQMRSRDNADNPAPSPAPSALLARTQVGIAAAFSRVVAACVEIIWNSCA